MQSKSSPAAQNASTGPVTAAPSIQSEILTVQEVADLLKVPKSSIYEWTRFRGGQRVPLPYRKIGKYIRVLRSELEAWLVGLPQARNMQKRRYVRKPDTDAPAPVKSKRNRRAA